MRDTGGPRTIMGIYLPYCSDAASRLHAFDCLNAKQAQPELDRPGGQVAEKETALAEDGRVGFEDGAMLEKAAVNLRKIPQIGTDGIGFVFSCGRLQGFAKA